MPHMYILECADGTFYTGSTRDLERRVEEHNSGSGANYTAKRIPVKLVYWEEFLRIDEAFAREKQIQNWSQTKKKALIEGKFESLPTKAKKNFKRSLPSLDTPPTSGCWGGTRPPEIS